MRHIDFDDLWKNHLFDYKDGDLLVIDDITRLNLSDYENTTLAFVMAVFCVEGRIQVVVEGQEYRMGSGDFFVYMPGQVIGEILLSQNADVKVVAFAQRAIDRSLYLHKFIWQNLEYVKEHPLFTLSERERQGLSHYYQLLMNKTVKEICTELDFPNLSFFGKFVKEHLGMSPTEYRQQNLNNECRPHPDQGREPLI